jgi:hypothetical protein
MTDLNNLTKNELAAIIVGMTASQIKKASHADLVQRAAALPVPVQPADVLDNSEWLTPTKAKPRGVEDRVLVHPTTDLDTIRPIRAGTKRHLMAVALARGTTLEHLAEITGWSRSVVSAAIYTDFKAAGLGIERKAGKLFLILPEGVKRLPVREAASVKATNTQE